MIVLRTERATPRIVNPTSQNAYFTLAYISWRGNRLSDVCSSITLVVSDDEETCPKGIETASHQEE
jgi:hypothetical protein